MRFLCIFLLACTICYAQDTFQRVNLKNGNYIDGIVIGENSDTILLGRKSGFVGIRKEYIKDIITITRRIKIEQPTRVIETPTTSTPKTQTESVTDLEVKQKVNDAIVRLKKASVDERNNILEEIVSFGEPAQPILAGLIDKDEDLLEWIAVAIIRIGDESAGPILLDKLDGASKRVKTSILHCLGQLKYTGALEKITTYLEQSDDELKMTAIDAISSIGEEESIDSLLELLNESNASVRRKAVAALVKLIEKHNAVEDVQDDIIRLLGDVQEDAVAEVVLLIQQLKITAAERELIELLEHPKAEARAAACQAIGELRLAGAVEDLLDILEGEKDKYVKIQVIQALQKIKNLKAVGSLIELLRDEDESVRFTASNALANITGQRFGLDYEKWKAWWAKAPK